MIVTIDDETHNEPTWETVEMAFSRLLSNKADAIDLMKDASEGLIASGEGNLVTIYYVDNKKRIETSLLNPEPKGIEYKMMVGNQYVEITDDILVPEEMAKRVFKLFFEGKDILTAQGLKWS